MRLLVTRPVDEGAAFKVRLEERGHRVTLEPLIEIELCADGIDLGGVRALIATSRNALTALTSSPILAEALGLPVFAVGPATGARALELGFQDVRIGPGTARGLADVIAGAALPVTGTLLHLAGDHVAFDLAGALPTHEIRQAVVYRSRAARALSNATQSKLTAGRLDGAVLMSPRASEIYVSLIARAGVTADARRLAYFCLSDAVARALAVLNPRRILVTQEPNFEVMLALIDRTDQEFR